MAESNQNELHSIKKGFRVATRIKVRYADLDTLQHVNNASYLSYLEEARIEYIEKVWDFDKKTLDFGVVVAHISIDYIAPILITDELKVYTRCVKIGTKSFTFESVFITNDQQIAAKSNVVLVTVNKDGIPVEIKEEPREKLREFEK